MVQNCRPIKLRHWIDYDWLAESVKFSPIPPIPRSCRLADFFRFCRQKLTALPTEFRPIGKIADADPKMPIRNCHPDLSLLLLVLRKELDHLKRSRNEPVVELENKKLMQLVKKSQTMFVWRKKSDSIAKSDARTTLPRNNEEVKRSRTSNEDISV